MHRFGLVSMVALPILFVVRLIYDLTHPENWDGDWLEDPRRYWPICLTVFLFDVVLAVWVWRQYRKLVSNMTTTAMLKFALAEARKSQEAGNWDEAERWLRCYEKVLQYGPSWPLKDGDGTGPGERRPRLPGCDSIHDGT